MNIYLIVSLSIDRRRCFHRQASARERHHPEGERRRRRQRLSQHRRRGAQASRKSSRPSSQKKTPVSGTDGKSSILYFLTNLRL